MREPDKLIVEATYRGPRKNGAPRRVHLQIIDFDEFVHAAPTGALQVRVVDGGDYIWVKKGQLTDVEIAWELIE